MNTGKATMIRLERFELIAKPILLILFLLTVSVFGTKTVVDASGRELSRALGQCKQGDTLILKSGKYRGKFFIPPQTVVISEELHGAVLDGSGHNRTVIMQNGSTLYGVAVTGARVGVYSQGIDNSIVGCDIYNNQQSGILAVVSAPLIQDNIIHRNSGSGITLWEIISDSVVVSHNSIVYNGNHGIIVGGESDLVISDNIIAFNHKLKIQVNEDSRITQNNNNYYFNVEINELLPQGNYSFDPRFVNPLKSNFRLTDSSRCFNSGTNGSNLGTEIFYNDNFYNNSNNN